MTAPRHAAHRAGDFRPRAGSAQRAKAKRHGSFQVYRPNVERDALRRENVRAADEIVGALNERRILLAFEPVVEARSRKPVFHECLMRIRRADGTLVRAHDVIPVAERLGLVRMLDHRVLELLVSEMVAVPALARQPQRVAGLDHRSGLVVGARRAAARQQGRGRAAHHRDHRDGGDPGHRRHQGLRQPRQGSRLPDRDRRFRRRLHLVPQPAQARRRHHQDRRRLCAEPHALGGRPRLRAHADRARQAARAQDRRRMGAGRAGGADARASGAATICRARWSGWLRSSGRGATRRRRIGARCEV